MRRVLVVLSAVLVVLAGASVPAAAHDDFHAPPHHPGPLPLGTSLNMRKVGHVNPGPGANADVYAFRGHAYLGSWIGDNCLANGVRVYDLANPAAPRRVSTFADRVSEPDLAGTWTEKVIVQRVHTRHFRGDVAVVSFQTCDSADTTTFRGFALYDVTRPARPKLLSRYSAPDTRGSHELWLGAHGGRAYVYTAIIDSEVTTGPNFDPDTFTADAPGRADFRIVEVSDPRRPRDVGEWGAWRQLGVGPDPNVFTHSVTVDDQLRRAYLSYWDLGTVILDISRPERPRFLGRTTPVQGNAHSSKLADGGRVLVETHEISGGLPAFYDISDPAHPRELTRFTLPDAELTTVHDPKIRGDRVYFSWYDFGVVVADISQPAQPRQVAQFVPDDPTPNPDFCPAVACPFTWGVFLYGRYVLAADMNSGLYVLELTR